MLRTGGWLAIVGVVVSVVVNLAHPHQDIPTDPFMKEVHEAGGIWIPLHYGISVAIIINLFATLAIARTLRDVVRQDLVKFANATSVMSAAVMITLMGIDGFATKHMADYYMAADDAGKAAAYPVAYAFLLILLAMLGLWYLLFFGIAVPLYSFAMLRGSFYPRWLGQLGVVVGVGGVATGSIIYIEGTSFLVSTVMFLLFSTLGLVWLLMAGVRQLQAAKTADTAKAPVAATADGS